ncbi:hypothetical protein AB0J74_15625 [Asanoa sp. NPDC049573]|uniref:hypothetical protein n=1 Tax=Asanoa sp. NPDC049573 TaxID=3155396 RepID=UPI0034454D53
MIEGAARQAAEKLFLVLVDRDKTLPWSKRAAMRQPNTILTVPAGGADDDRVPYGYHLHESQLQKRKHPAYGSGVRDAFFADEGCEELICRTFTDAVDATGWWRYVVVDAAGRQIGAIERVPPRNALSRHGWRLRQPGQPELLARDLPLLKRTVKAAPWKALELAIAMPAELLLGGGGGLQDVGSSPIRRELEWWTRPDEPAVLPEKALTKPLRAREPRAAPWQIWASWLDRRLVLAQMLIPDQ